MNGEEREGGEGKRGRGEGEEKGEKRGEAHRDKERELDSIERSGEGLPSALMNSS